MTILSAREYDNFTVEIVSLGESRVEFVDGMKRPMETLTTLSEGYEGIYRQREHSSEDIQRAITNMNKTKLNTPLEMIMNVFLFTGVTRAFTHQLVRTRIGASFVQESMRFLGHQGVYRVLALGGVSRNSQALIKYSDAIRTSIVSYEDLIRDGVSSEDARGVLPTNILTAAYVGYAMTTLRTVYSQRMCCQAQPGEWQIVMRDVKKVLVAEYGSQMNDMISAPYERGEPCGYRASFDRPCTWQKEKS